MSNTQYVLLLLGLGSMDAQYPNPVRKHFTGGAAADINVQSVEDSMLKLQQSLVRKAEGPELHMDANGNVKNITNNVDKDLATAHLIRKHAMLGQVAADGSVEIVNSLGDPTLELPFVRKATEAGINATNESRTAVNSVQEEYPLSSSTLVQIRFSMMTTTVLPRVLLPILISLAFIASIALLLFACKNPLPRDKALKELHDAGQRAAKYAMSETDDWRQASRKLRELRKDKFSTNHPLYATVEAHMREAEIQTQLQRLFAELKQGETLVTVEQLKLMLTNLQYQVTILGTGNSCIDHPTPSDYAWLINGAVMDPNHTVDDPTMNFSTFLSLVTLLHVVLVQAKIINIRADASTQAAEGEEIWPVRIEYSVEVHGHVACRANFEYGPFTKAGAAEKLELERDAAGDEGKAGGEDAEEETLSGLDEADAEAIAAAIEASGRRPSQFSSVSTASDA